MTQLLSDLATLAGVDRMLALLVVKATLILLAALAITVVMQRATAGARHLVWLVTLGALLMVPVLGAWAPLRLEILPSSGALSALGARLSAAEPLEASSSTEDPAAPAPDGQAGAESYVKLGELTATPDDDVAATGVGATMMRAIAARPFASLAALWALVVAGILGWLAWGALQVRRIVRRAHPLDTADWTGPMYEVADRLELEEAPRLVSSGDVRMPFACGFTNATIVLPSTCEEWTLDRRRAVLLHELAHVKRRDLLGHTLGRVACALYWFHPLAWTAARRLRAESERACDDMAVAAGARPSDYAEHLLDIVTSVRHDRTPAVALAMARRKEFEGRMLAILDGDVRRAAPSRRQSAVLVAALGSMALLVGAAAPAPRSPLDEQGAGSVAAADTGRKSRAKEDARRERRADSASADGWVAVGDVNDVNDASDVGDANDANDAFDAYDAADAHDAYDGRSVARARAEARIDRQIDARMDAQVDARVDAQVDARTDARLDARVDVQVDSGDREETRSEARVRMGAEPRPLAPRSPSSDQARQVQPGARLRGDERPELLAEVLRSDSSASLRRIAAWGLAEHAGEEIAVSALARALRSDANARVREMAAWSLSHGRRDDRAVDALSSAATSDAQEEVRATATWALGNLGLRDSEEALLKVLDDRSESVRMRATWALGNIGIRRAPARVVALLRDESRDVRMLAAWVLFRTEDPSAAPALEAALREEQDRSLRSAYIRAIAAMGERSVDAVRPLLQSSDPEIRSMAVRALAGGHASGPWPWPWPEPRPYP